MFNPLGFTNSASLDPKTAETCGCACSGVVGVSVDDVIVIVAPAQ